MLKVLYFSSETKKKFGVYNVISVLEKKLKTKITIKISKKINDIVKYKPNLIHIHGCWKPHLFLVFIIAKIMSIKLVFSPHGMLDPYSFNQKKIKKLFAWILYQKLLINFSDLVIVNSKIEKSNILNKININKKILVIKHGVLIDKSFRIKKSVNKKIKFIFFSRIHPSKNLHSIINIWKNNYFFNKYELDIYGEITDQKYFRKINYHIKNEKNINYKGVIKNSVQKILVNYDVFLHPSESENFGLVILEAMSAGLFLIVNKKLDWKDLAKKGYCYNIIFNSSNLIEKILILEKKKLKIKNIIYRRKLYNYVKNNYNWDFISDRYKDNYLFLVK